MYRNTFVTSQINIPYSKLNLPNTQDRFLVKITALKFTNILRNSKTNLI